MEPEAENLPEGILPDTPSLREQVALLPQSPGVYLFKAEDGTVMYVGKAIRLRDRVRSYFAKDIAVTRNPGIEKMVRTAVTLDHKTVPTELEALILEARLIRQLKPRYNIRLTDDKSFVVIKIDLSHEFPPITVGREKELEEALIRRKREREGVRISRKVDNVEYYGPFTSSGAVRAVLKTVRAIWPYRDCSQTKYDTYAAMGHGCLFAHLGLCTAPCAANIGKEGYRADIDQIRQFLRGECEPVIKLIQSQMDSAATEERYEDAARARNRLYSVEHFRHIVDTFRDAKGVTSGGYQYDPEKDLRVECYDISHNQGDSTVGSLVSGIIRGGRSESVETRDEGRQRFLFERARYKKFKIKTVEGVSDTDSLREMLDRRFKRAAGKAEHWSLPDLILIDGGLGQYNVIKEARAAAGFDGKVGLAAVAKGPTRKKVDLRSNDWGRYPFVATEAWLVVAELLREEAHRFAITYYRMLHRKSLFEEPGATGRLREAKSQLRRMGRE